MNAVNIAEGAEGFTLALFTRHLGWSADRTFEFLQGVEKELAKPGMKLWLRM